MVQSSTAILVSKCHEIIRAYDKGLLGSYDPAESIAPRFSNLEDHLIYYTLPMALNYRRPSIQLWQAAKLSHTDEATKRIFDLHYAANAPFDEIQGMLSNFKLAMQPTRHTLTWTVIASTIDKEWGSIENLLKSVDYDFLALKKLIQVTYKKGFPYLSGPKIFNFWCYILSTRCGVTFKNKDLIEIAVDGHITKCSVKLGVISAEEAVTLTAERIAERWRIALEDTQIAPVDLNIPLWYWSRNNFTFGQKVPSNKILLDA